MQSTFRGLLFLLFSLLACLVQADPTTPASAPAAPVVCPILIYHGVREYRSTDRPNARRYIITPKAFEKELQFLADQHATTVSFAELADAVESGTPLPPNPVIISLDDGSESQYQNAFPLLKKYGFHATFFIFTNGIGAKHFMSVDQLRELSDAGMEIGGHSRSHPYLARISDPRRLRMEILDSRMRLEQVLGRPVTTFAYPFGHYTDQIVRIVKEAGYRSARSTYPGVRHSLSDLFTLTGLIDVTNVARIESGLEAAELSERPEYPPPGIDPVEYIEAEGGY